MSGPEHPPGPVDDTFGRPYLAGGTARGRPTVPASPDPVAPTSDVRPYLLTGGRTRAHATTIAMESIVVATGVDARRPGDPAGRERTDLVRLARQPCSVAELAAWLHLPLQVALVLVGDLVAEGRLDATVVGTHQADDVHFLERLIAGVAAL